MATVNADLKSKLSIAKVGVNYKFDWSAPLVVKCLRWPHLAIGAVSGAV